MSLALALKLADRRFPFPKSRRKRSFHTGGWGRCRTGSKDGRCSFICQPQLQSQTKLQFEVYQGNAAAVEKSEMINLQCLLYLLNLFWSGWFQQQEAIALTKDLPIDHFVIKLHQRLFQNGAQRQPFVDRDSLRNVPDNNF